MNPTDYLAVRIIFDRDTPALYIPHIRKDQIVYLHNPIGLSRDPATVRYSIYTTVMHGNRDQGSRRSRDEITSLGFKGGARVGPSTKQFRILSTCAAIQACRVITGIYIQGFTIPRFADSVWRAHTEDMLLPPDGRIPEEDRNHRTKQLLDKRPCSSSLCRFSASKNTAPLT